MQKNSPQGRGSKSREDFCACFTKSGRSLRKNRLTIKETAFETALKRWPEHEKNP